MTPGEVVIVLVAAGPGVRRIGQVDPNPGDYLAEYDPEAMGGAGLARWTTDPAKAKVFPTIGDALKAWQAVPKRRPRRGDGRPNRPLTAYTVTFEAAPETPPADPPGDSTTERITTP